MPVLPNVSRCVSPPSTGPSKLVRVRIRLKHGNMCNTSRGRNALLLKLKTLLLRIDPHDRSFRNAILRITTSNLKLNRSIVESEIKL